ncbi:chloride channel protein [Psittacicella hinzii]|uniref:H+/Cl-antiporter ClcA n=1 Tax=Psittacicella hinzii TaxID=2028575 RepID=A0A3A1YL10_9GAMM|nr:chloride channel protein [Psittacicella hinzii]RIY37909.1 hypothetical protein CKF58_04505 [Psittacicella hinzii]
MMNTTFSAKLRLVLAIIFIGVVAGLGAAFLSWLIHQVEHLVFGHSESEFRIVTDGTTWQQRLLGLTIGGVVIGILWACLQMFGRAIVGINGMIKGKKAPMPENIAHSLLQIFAVGVGAPVGREVAPREIGALFAGTIADKLKIDAQMRSILVACGAAAGLAGVYHVPFAGTIFALEILIGVINVPYAIIALSISVIATFVARITVSAETFYLIPQISGTAEHIMWAAILGLLVGIPAKVFRLQVKWAESTRFSKKHLFWALPLGFIISGIVAIWLPQILGNGRSTAQTAYWASVSLGVCISLFIAKWLTVLVTLKAGAYGGTLTPGLAIGAILGTSLGMIFHFWFPSMDVVMAALVCSAAFLAVSMNAPFTAFALTIGFTGQSFDAYLPMLVCICMAYASASLIGNKPTASAS